MTSIVQSDDMDPPYCEVCGEQHATLKIAMCAVCDDCYADEMRQALAPVLGYRPCCFPIWQRCREMAICVAVSGTEHDHCA